MIRSRTTLTSEWSGPAGTRGASGMTWVAPAAHPHVSWIVVMQRDRAQLLRALIGYELPIEPVLADLRSFGWDAPELLVLLNREDIVRVLDRSIPDPASAPSSSGCASIATS